MAEVIPVTEKDHDTLATFLAEFPNERRPKDVWQDLLTCWWDKNPAFQQGIDRGWVLWSADNIVGFLGNIPSLFKVGDRTITAFNATTWRVQPQFRGYSLELLTRLMRAAQDSLLFDTTPNDTVVKILKRLNFKLLSSSDKGRSYAVTSLDRVIQERLANRPIPRLISRSLEVLAVGISSPWLSKPRPVPGVDVIHLDIADQAFDRLWERTKGQYENTNVRTSRIINWYCFGNANIRKELFGCYRNGDLVGYLVCSYIGENGYRKLDCVDLWTDAENVEVAKALVFAAIQYAKERRYSFVSMTYFNSFVGQVCRKAGMHSRGPVSHTQYMRVSPDLAPLVRESNSYFVKAQGDYALTH